MMNDRGKKVVDYGKSKPHAAYEYKDAWEAGVLTVGGKTFAMFGVYKDGRPLVTLKSDPARALELRDAFRDVVIPGYYSNKQHWNSVFLDADIEDGTIFGMVDESYRLVFEGLPKKTGLGWPEPDGLPWIRMPFFS